MKTLIITLCSFCLLFSTPSMLIVFAANPDTGSSNVTITVVMPENEASSPTSEPPTESPIIKLYPVDIEEIHDDSGWQIIKTYELSEDELPGDIPRNSFQQNGWLFTLTDILRKETASAETREHTESLTLNTDTKELEQLLPLFSPTMEYKADDGSVGILSLDVASIKVETAGTKTSNYTMSVIREYPHLSSNDTNLIPKTIEDRGTTYSLAGVEWKAGNTVTVDYEALPESYTAIATYTATGSSVKITGYLTTATYTGTLTKLSQGKTVYTAYFNGKEIITPLETVAATALDEASTADSAETDLINEPQKSDNFEYLDLMWLAIIPVIVLLYGMYYCVKKKGRSK